MSTRVLSATLATTSTGPAPCLSLGAVRSWCEASGPWLGHRRAVAEHYSGLTERPWEELIAVGLSADDRACVEIRLRGTASGVKARPMDLLPPIVASGARRLVVLHNHPSGDPYPSDADIAFTERLVAACLLLGLQLCDHLILARLGCVSLLRGGKLQHPTLRRAA